MSIGDKLPALMALRGFETLDALAAAVRRAGAPTVKYQHLQQLVKYPNRQPRYLMQLAAVFGMTVEEFMAWRPGRPLPDATSGPASGNYRINDEVDGGWADILGVRQRIALGDGIPIDEYAETHRLKFKTASLRRKRLNPTRLAVCYGSGDSMEPRIHDGDAILFDTGDRHPQDGKLFVVFYDNRLLAKQLSNLDGIWYLESLNRSSREWRKPVRIEGHKSLEIQGRIRWIGSWED
jgi:phage repressor protein C with HTH and peptisase S24 domain